MWFFKSGRTNVHNEERSGKLSLVSDDLPNQVNEKLQQNHRFTILELSDHFPEISRNLLHEIGTEKLGYKFCACWIPKLLTDNHKTKRMSSVIDFLSQYHFEREKYLDRIVTGDETWVAYVNPETKEQSMQWGHTLFQESQRKSIKLCWRGKSWLQCFGMLKASYSLIYGTRYDHHFGNLLWHFGKTQKSDPKQASWPSDVFCYVCA